MMRRDSLKAVNNEGYLYMRTELKIRFISDNLITKLYPHEMVVLCDEVVRLREIEEKYNKLVGVTDS